jgi:hypothetical protein
MSEPRESLFDARSRRVPSKDVLLTKQLLAEEPKPKGRCSFCGAPARGGDVCHAHSDLVKGVRT